MLRRNFGSESAVRTGARVVVIEDDTEVASVIKERLSAGGFSVTHAATIEAGRSLLSDGEWDVIVLDLMLPDGSGLDLAKQIRQRGDETPILMLTARDTVHERVTCLTRWLVRRTLELQYSGGQPLVRVYGPTGSGMRGATMAMNFLEPDGTIVDHQKIELLAAERGISLRTGCFCNPGAGEVALGLTKGEIESCFSHGGSDLTLEEFRGCIDPEKGTGAVRVSLGIVSTLEDVEAFIAFARSLAR